MSPSTIAPTEIGGRYTVERELGYGATATVYLCRDRETSTHVAVKVLRVELAESLGAERFLREIRVTAGLQHPNIVPVVDSGADGSILYCVLPYLEGGTLRDLLRESRQLAIPDAVHIGRTIAGALEYAHGKGLIHRDIKPENILFSGGTAFLGDFGIARLLHATQGDLTTTTGVVRGTPAYMSPEQASGERDYDGRSDIYSLACVVYEMVSGMPPFVGPTSQSVLAQRFSSRPRPMRVYRNTVTADLEQVIDKALATSPADRYATINEFRAALEAAGRATPATIAAKSRRTSRLIVVAAGGAAIIAAGLLVANRANLSTILGPGTPPDTAHLAVLPFERDGNSDALGSVDAFMYDAFSAWRGLTVPDPVQVLDAVTRQGSLSGVARDRAVAIALGAGRFVRGSVSALPDGSGWRVRASLHQVERRSDTTLHSHLVTIRIADLASIDAQYAALARVLLLRGLDSGGSSAVVATTSLPAMQFFTRGIAAVDEWDFPLADSLFQQAIAIDPEYRRAYLWQAQVRFWQRTSPEQWAPLAQKALVDTTKLHTRDHQLAVALRALGDQNYDAACAAYDRLAQKNDADFAAWFGKGRCRDLDFRVFRDGKSPTGWSYRSSYSDAVGAYRKAFEVLSLSHRSLERGAFEPLRDLLFMRPSKLQAAVPPAGETTVLAGRLDWENDKAILRPVPAALISAGDPTAVPAGMRTAILSQQRLFATIASSWSTALPKSAGAKEAVVVALEMHGDRSALDTLRSALGLATEAEAKLRLASAEVVLRLKFANPEDTAEFSRIRRLADSLIAATPSPTVRQAASLASLAAMTGRCELAGELTAQAPTSALRGLARDVLGAADAFLVRTILGCATNPGAEVQRLRGRIEASSAAPGSVNSLLLRAVQATDGADTSLTASFAGSGVYLLSAQRAVHLRRPDTTRRILARVDSARMRTGYDDISPDATYLESRMFLGIGDTAVAAATLDRLLDRLSFLTPGMLNKPADMGGLMRAMRLRGEIGATRVGDMRGAQWGAGQRILWAPAGRKLDSGVAPRP